MRPWIYLQNPILNAAASFTLGMEISTYHDSALAAVQNDPFIQQLFGTYHPIHMNYKALYDGLLTHSNIRRGDTLNLNQLIRLLSGSKIKQWDIKIQITYDQSTPEYKRLLPNRRGPFQEGSQMERIHAVKTLSDAIGADTALAAVKTDIDNFYTMLDTTYTTQKGGISLSKAKSDELEAGRVAMCVTQYGNLGALIQKYAATPEIVEQFFDMNLIRNPDQAIFTGHLKPGEAYTIVKHTFGASDEIKLSNPGSTPLKFYLANTQNMQPTGTTVTIVSGSQIVLASSLGNLADTYLTVLNTSTAQTGEFSIEIL